MTVLVVLGVGVAAWAVLEWWPALTRRPWRNTLAHDGRQTLNGAGVAFATLLAIGMFTLAATAPPGIGWWRHAVEAAGITLLCLAVSSGWRLAQ